MASIKPNARERTKRRVRGSLWLAAALMAALPAWMLGSFRLLDGTAATLAGLAPVATYGVWRAVSELTDENDAGISLGDRLWEYFEKLLPPEGVRRVAMRTVKAVAVMAALALFAFAMFRFVPRPEAPPEAAPLLVQAPTATPVTPAEPRPVTGLFSVKVEVFPQLVWPAYGYLESLYGGGINPYGIDITFPGEGDARVQASGRGSVTYAGPDSCCGFGSTVVVVHDDGWTTTYGHLTGAAVKPGDRVKPGDTLGYGGAEAGQRRSMHYQVQRQGRSYDPLQVLAASQIGLPPLPGTNQMCGGDALMLDPNSVANLALTSTDLRRYEIDGASVMSITDGAPEIAAEVSGLLSLVLTVPPTSEASYVLQLTLRAPEDRIAIECAMSVLTAAEVPMALEPVRRQVPVITPTPFGGPPTPVPSATPTETPPPVSGTPHNDPAVRTVRPSPTPFSRLQRFFHTPTPTATPKATATPRPGSRPRSLVTPRPTLTPTPSKPPTQTAFPRQYELLFNAGG